MNDVMFSGDDDVLDLEPGGGIPLSSAAQPLDLLEEGYQREST